MRPTAYEASKMTGLLGGLGKNRHRLQHVMAQAADKAKPKPSPKPKKSPTPSTFEDGAQVDTGYQTADPGKDVGGGIVTDDDIDTLDPKPKAPPGYGSIGLTIGIHHLGAGHMSELRSMNKKNRHGGFEV